MQPGEAFGKGRHGRAQLRGVQVVAMHATGPMAITTRKVKNDFFARRHDAVEVAVMAFQIEFTARNGDFIEPDEFFQGLLAVAHDDDVLLLHDHHDPPVILARIATPNDLELESVDLLLQEEIFLRTSYSALQLRFVAEVTHPRPILADFGLKDQGVAVTDRKGPRFFEPFFDGVFHRQGEQGTTAGIPLEGT